MASSPAEFRYSSEGAPAAAKEIRTSSLANRSCRPRTRSPPLGRSVVRTWRGISGWFGGARHPLALHDRRGRVHVIEERGIGDEALLAHQFLGVQTAIGTAETYVALARNLPGHPVIRHIVSFDAKIARHGRLAAARHLAPVPAPVPRSLPARRGAPACRERRCSFDYRRVLLHPGSAAGRTTSLR